MTDEKTTTPDAVDEATRAAGANAAGEDPGRGDVSPGGGGAESTEVPPEPVAAEASVPVEVVGAGGDSLAQAKAEAVRLREQLLRTAADFDNFRKRTRKEVTDAERRAREELLRDLLPVFDNLERASAHAGAATDTKALADGIEMVVRQFLDTLTRLGVERVPSVGSAFDPALHEALQQMETTDFEPGCVTTEVQAGYKMGDRLVRPALVIVAKRPAAPTTGA